MRKAALKAKTRRGFRPCSNSSTKAAGVVEDLLRQEFSPATPNRCWAGDITYIRTSNGWRYLAVWIDGYYNRERRHSTIGYLSPFNYEQVSINTRTLTPVEP